MSHLFISLYDAHHLFAYIQLPYVMFHHQQTYHLHNQQQSNHEQTTIHIHHMFKYRPKHTHSIYNSSSSISSIDMVIDSQHHS